MPLKTNTQPIAVEWSPTLAEVQDSWANYEQLDQAVAEELITCQEAYARREGWAERQMRAETLSQFRLDIATEKLGEVPSATNNWGLTNHEFSAHVIDVNGEWATYHTNFVHYITSLERQHNIDLHSTSLAIMLTIEQLAKSADDKKQAQWNAKYNKILFTEILDTALPDCTMKHPKNEYQCFRATTNLLAYMGLGYIRDLLTSVQDSWFPYQLKRHIYTNQENDLSKDPSPVARMLHEARYEFYATAKPFVAEIAKSLALTRSSCPGKQNIKHNVLGVEAITRLPSYSIRFTKTRHRENTSDLIAAAQAYIKEQKERPNPATQPKVVAQNSRLFSEEYWRNKWEDKQDIYDSSYNCDLCKFIDIYTPGTQAHKPE